MRYIGSKVKLIDEIHDTIEKAISLNTGTVFCDMFSGTGAVAESFKDRCNLIVNDNLYACFAVSKSKILNATGFFAKLGLDPFDFFNKADTDGYTSGFCYNNFAPAVSGRQYFSDENAKRIDFIRDTIDLWYSENKISSDEKDYLIGCLIESVSKVSNVAGVYSAFLHIWDPRAVKRLELLRPDNSTPAAGTNRFFLRDANSLIGEIEGDILYLDPPYTSTQYISQYHVLETIAKNDRPVTHGKGAHRDNGDQLSKWSKKGAVENEFVDLIAQARFRHIVVSYSDAGLMSKEFIEKTLKRFALPGTYRLKKIDFVKYKNTRAVKREERENLKDSKHFEWLFIIEKNPAPLFQSPLNYIGGKYDVVGFLKQHFPRGIRTFYDLFGGGATVSLNAEADRIVYNDNNWIVCGLLRYLAAHDSAALYKKITALIKKYGLSKSNKEAYVRLRNDYNAVSARERDPLLLYLLICYGFEHQIRFNANLEFNNPCGNSGFNDEMYEKLITFARRARQQNIQFRSEDYQAYLDELTPGDFVYCDPPYLSTCGVYTDGRRGFNGWDAAQQRGLMLFLEQLHGRNIRFMLSNYAEHAESDNNELILWAKKNGFTVICNDKITKRNRQNRRELIIVNYEAYGNHRPDIQQL